jgi:ABC-type Fe3+ transport system permease subunit
VEIIVSLVLHPVAVVLAWINLYGRSNIDGTRKLLWAVVVLIWGIGPILYILLDDGSLW